MAEIGRIILNRLLDKFEKSDWMLNGFSSRRIMIDCSKDVEVGPIIADYNSTASGQTEYLSSLEKMESLDLIMYSRDKRYYEIIDKIWLAHPESPDNAYAFCGRRRPDRQAELLSDYMDNIEVPIAEISTFIKNTSIEIRRKKKINPCLGNDFETAKDTVRALTALSAIIDSDKVETERIFSTRIMGWPSKYFENEVRKHLVSVLQKIFPDEEKNNLLPSMGLLRYPQIIAFSGYLVTGTSVYSEKGCSSYIDSDNIMHMPYARTTASRITTIENRATYYEYIRKKASDELVIWTSGFPSPSVRKLLCMLFSSCSVFRHWGDIDVGGFRIFRKLKDEVPVFEPMKMDAKTLLSAEFGRHPLTDKGNVSAYICTLNTMKDDEQYQMFHDVINVMLEKGIWLEQEGVEIS